MKPKSDIKDEESVALAASEAFARLGSIARVWGEPTVLDNELMYTNLVIEPQ